MVEEAVKNNNLQFIMDMNLHGDDIHHVLCHASIHGRMDIILYLVSQGADLDSCLLQQACVHGQFTVVKYYVTKGVDVGKSDNWAVICACCGGYLDIVKYLVSHGAYVRACRDTAILLASEKGHLDTVNYLVSQGANVARINIKMWKNMCATRIQQFYKRQYTRRKLLRVLKEVIPLYYHPQAKGGYFARKALLECC
jgi:ankyrin repeat protein